MRRAALLGLALAFVAGCAGDATSPSVSLNGTYSLRSIDGYNLPYTFTGGPTLTNDMMTLYSDGTYEDVSTYSNAQSSSRRGYFTSINGSAVTLTDQASGLTYQASLSGSVLTEIVNGYTEAYLKN